MQVKQSAQDHKMGAFECGILRLARVYALCKVSISLDDFMSNNMRMRSTQVDFACLICWVGPYCVPLPSVVLPIPCLGAFKKSCW